MRPTSIRLLIATSLCVVTALPTTAQSVNRIRQSINKATGGAAGAPGRPQIPPPAPTPEQVAAQQASQAAQLKRQQENAAAAEAKVIPFLQERVDGGSADAAVDLAKRYETGKGVAVDAKAARRLYQLGAERGNEEAKAWLKEHPASPSVPAAAKTSTPPAPTAKAPEKK